MPTNICPNRKREPNYVPKYKSISAILEDHDLAALGDAYVNLVYSLALSGKTGKPVGRKADSSTLAAAIRRANLRKLLPSRTDRHKQADAAESLIVYAWLVGDISFEETLSIMESEKTAEDAFSVLLKEIFEAISRRLPT